MVERVRDIGVQTIEEFEVCHGSNPALLFGIVEIGPRYHWIGLGSSRISTAQPAILECSTAVFVT
jgi:hypothetical protein